jgi:hypothetical protein
MRFEQTRQSGETKFSANQDLIGARHWDMHLSVLSTMVMTHYSQLILLHKKKKANE